MFEYVREVAMKNAYNTNIHTHVREHCREHTDVKHAKRVAYLSGVA